MQHFYLYILKCSDGSYYTGHTDNIEKRLTDHIQGVACEYTAKRLPVELVFVEAAGSRDAAFKAEHQIKRWTRRKKEALIKNGWEGMQGFCKRDRKAKKN